MSTYGETIQALEASCGQASGWSDISPEYAARMRLQNRFKTGLTLRATRQQSCAKTWPIMIRILASTRNRSVAGTVLLVSRS